VVWFGKHDHPVSFAATPPRRGGEKHALSLLSRGGEKHALSLLSRGGEKHALFLFS
jgi:hypothetical protein